MNKFCYLFRRRYNLRKKMGCRCYSEKHGYAASLTEQLEESELQAKYQPLEKLPRKAPFIKNLFRAKFDTDFLAYPEFLNQARIDLLERNADVVRKLLDEHVNSTQIDHKAAVPEELLEKLRSLKLFGLSAPRSLGGAEFTHTERARIMETIGSDPSIAVLLFQHETLGHQLIAQYGDESLKKRFLPSLVSGQKYAALCYGEADSGSDATKFETNAIRAGTSWLLSGTKVWVTNANKADLFLVVAKVRLLGANQLNPYYVEEGDEQDQLSAEELGIFLVEKNAANVKVGAPMETIGLRGVPMCEVTFDNVEVPEHMVLTDFCRGYDVVKRLLTEDRYVIGCIAAATLRKALTEASAYCVSRRLHDTNLYHYEFAQRRLGRMLLYLYAIESMVYFTTGIMDMYAGQDCEVENAITKVFCTEAALKAVNDAIAVMGGSALLEGSSFDRYQRNLRSLILFDHHNDLYRGTIALNSLQYISTALNDLVMVNRNPLFYSFKHIKQSWTMKFIRTDEENPILYLRLKDYLHPSLMYLAEQLEYCVLRFEHGINQTLSRLGPDTVHDQMYIRRIADCAIALYSMTAVLSRASRSYCIGTEHADEEIILAETYIRDTHDAFKETVTGLHHGEYFVTDHNFKKLSQKAVEFGGYFSPKPYKLNY